MRSNRKCAPIENALQSKMQPTSCAVTDIFVFPAKAEKQPGFRFLLLALVMSKKDLTEHRSNLKYWVRVVVRYLTATLGLFGGDAS